MNDASLGGEMDLDPKRTHSWAHTIQKLSLCGRHLRRLLGEASLPWNLSDTEFLLLWTCDEGCINGDGVMQHDLVFTLGLSSAQMSGLVYDLRDRGLLTVERPAHDRRRQVVRVTSAGRTLLHRVMETMAPIIAQLEAEMPDSDHQTLSHLLTNLIDRTQDRAGLMLPSQSVSSIGSMGRAS